MKKYKTVNIINCIHRINRGLKLGNAVIKAGRIITAAIGLYTAVSILVQIKESG